MMVMVSSSTLLMMSKDQKGTNKVSECNSSLLNAETGEEEEVKQT